MPDLRQPSILTCFLLLSVSQAALAAPRMKPVGVGALVEETGADREYLGVIEGNNHFRQRMTAFGIRQYGFGESRLEIGQSLGVHMSATSGITLVGLEGGAKIFPHIGIEPFSGRINWSTQDDRIDYYEWLPMASFGVQAAVASCRALPLVRAGAGLGTLNRTGSGFGPFTQRAYGYGAHLNCSRLDLALESTRVGSGNDSTQLATVDVAFHFQPNWQIGMRGESLHSLAREGDPLERRVIFTIRGNPFELVD